MTDKMMQLIRELNDRLAQDAMLRQGRPVETIRLALVQIMREHWESVLPGTDIEAAQVIDQGGDLSAIASALADRKALHDLRVSELLAANSTEVERRRAAERELANKTVLMQAGVEGLGSQLLDVQRECITWKATAGLWEGIAMKRGAGGPTDAEGVNGINLVGFLADIMGWQDETFGPHQSLGGVVDHAMKEMREIKADPTDALEWIDLMTLCVSALRLMGKTADQAVATWIQKLAVLKARDWPDWRKADPDKAIEHVRDIPVVLRTIEHPEPRGYSPVVAMMRSGLRMSWGIRSSGPDGAWWINPTTGAPAEYDTGEAAQAALDAYRNPPPQSTTPEVTFTTAAIERAFRGYLAAGPGKRRQPKWHDREWELFRSGLQARRLAGEVR